MTMTTEDIRRLAAKMATPHERPFVTAEPDKKLVAFIAEAMLQGKTVQIRTDNHLAPGIVMVNTETGVIYARNPGDAAKIERIAELVCENIQESRA